MEFFQPLMFVSVTIKDLKYIWNVMSSPVDVCNARPGLFV